MGYRDIDKKIEENFKNPNAYLPKIRERSPDYSKEPQPYPIRQYEPTKHIQIAENICNKSVDIGKNLIKDKIFDFLLTFILKMFGF